MSDYFIEFHNSYTHTINDDGLSSPYITWQQETPSTEALIILLDILVILPLQVHRCGPVTMFVKLVRKWSHLSVVEVGAKVGNLIP